MALTLCGRPSHAVLLKMLTHIAVRNPGDIATSGLASSAFARHYSRNLGWCLFLALLRCFSSGGSPHTPILFSVWYLAVGFPIRKSPDRRIFAPPRSLSQLITSFIGSWCQGIPLALLLAWPRRNQLRIFPYLLSQILPLLRCFSSQIKTHFIGLLICFLKQCSKLRFVISIQ